MIVISTFWCKSNPFNDDHVDVDEKQPFLYYDANDSETGTTYHLSYIQSIHIQLKKSFFR